MTQKASTRGQKEPSNVDFTPVFSALRAILAKHEAKLVIVHDRVDQYYLDTHTIGPNKRPIAFGGVRIGKRYVSYYLMPLYAATSAMVLSPELKKRMQGKACFNFTSTDKTLLKELDRLTTEGYRAWHTLGWVD